MYSKVSHVNSNGVCAKFINKTGAPSVIGTVVAASSTTDIGVQKITVDVPAPFGVIIEEGIPDGQEVWVCIAGIADVLFVGSVTRGGIARGFVSSDAGYVAGSAMYEAYPTSPFATDKHFYEIGHTLENRTGAGLARVTLHFN